MATTTTAADVRTIILDYICPACGCLLANVMFAAPFRDLQNAVKNGQLGALNPTPWAFMLGNCFGWVLYGILIHNFWTYFANAPGFLLSIWLNLGAAKLLYQGHYSHQMPASLAKRLSSSPGGASSSTTILPLSQTVGQGKPSTTRATTTTTAVAPSTVKEWTKIVRDVTSQTTPAPVQHETLVLAISFVWMAIATFVAFGDDSMVNTSTKQLVVGVLVNLNSIFFYGAPLSTIKTVVQTKSSASIHIATMATNTMNGAFWTAYGFAVNDYFIYVPNGLGALLGGIQIILCVVYPRTKVKSGRGAAEDADKSYYPAEEQDTTARTADSIVVIDVEQPLELAPHQVKEQEETGDETDDAAVISTDMTSKDETLTADEDDDFLQQTTCTPKWEDVDDDDDWSASSGTAEA